MAVAARLGRRAPRGSRGTPNAPPPAPRWPPPAHTPPVLGRAPPPLPLLLALLGTAVLVAVYAWAAWRLV